MIVWFGKSRSAGLIALLGKEEKVSSGFRQVIESQIIESPHG